MDKLIFNLRKNATFFSPTDEWIPVINYTSFGVIEK